MKTSSSFKLSRRIVDLQFQTPARCLFASSNHVAVALSLLFLVGSYCSTGNAQSLKSVTGSTITDRVIYLLHASTDESQLAIVQIELSGKAITPGQPFAADENWLRNLKIRFTNLSDKPITGFVLGGGLIRGVNEELTSFESYQEGIAWKFGEDSDPKSGGEKRKSITLLSKQVVELGYESIDPYYKNAREFERGLFCKLELGPASIQFEDGTTETASRIKYKR